MGLTHFDEAPFRTYELGHIRGRWTRLGEAAGSVGVGLRRIELPAGGWSTPAHEHGAEEEIFYVLAGRGLSWQGGRVAQIGAGDCIAYLPLHGAHTLHALEALDVLAFGPRLYPEVIGFPRLGRSLVGARMVHSDPYAIEGAPAQFVYESQLGPPELPPEPGPRPPTLVNLEAVESKRTEQARVARMRRNLGVAVGSVKTGLQHVEVDPGKESVPQHCHSLEEEIFVVLAGDGVLVLDDEETAVRPGHVIARPAATGVAHMFRAGEGGLTYLAYGTREPGDVCYYPRSNKIGFRGVRVIARLERLDYWDGEN
ncbi:MAG: hypothetical protein NVS4B10_24800 [Myxococcales bacterium]